MDKGYVQIYTGEGKGKTTAALGLALRAVCAGRRVLIVQFLKGMDTSELRALDYLPGLEIEQCGGGEFVSGSPVDADKERAREGLERVRRASFSGEYDIVIADEINNALALGLMTADEVLAVMRDRSPGTELVLTGRGALAEIIYEADLVTEMREVKHYYTAGVTAREGIEM